MPFKNKTRMSQRLLPLDAVKLGRFVVNADEPHQDYIDPLPRSAPEQVETVQQDLITLYQDDAASHGKVDPPVDVKNSKLVTNKAAVATAKCVTRQLANSREWFRQALQEAPTRKWFEDSILAGEDIYLIIGYQTVLDAKLTGEQRSTKQHSASVTAPISTALANAGIILAFNVMPDPQVAIATSRGHQLRGSHVAPGEQISAVQYRQVKFKWYSSRDLDKAQLERGSWWRIQWDFRDNDGDDMDIIQPYLSDSEDE